MTDTDENLAPSMVYDVVIYTCGYERRARWTAQHLSPSADDGIVLDYLCGGVFEYDVNSEFYGSLGYHRVPIGSSLHDELRSYLENLNERREEERLVNILFDVSSCSRRVMATVLLAVREVFQGSASVTCSYALSRFDEPPSGELPSHISEPVVGDLSGWSENLSRPPCAIIGLGFEPGRALGCIDYLEIPEVRLFMPIGPDARFKNAVEAANAVLIAEAGEAYVLPYDVLDAEGTYEKLESLVYGLLPQYRPVIVPLGPKIFAAVSIVLAAKMDPDVCVWRTSAGPDAEVADRHASGYVARFTARL